MLYLSTISSESGLLWDWWFTFNQYVLAKNPLRLTTSNFIFQLNICGYSPYVTSSPMRGRVSRLQLLLALASAVILRSESRGNHDHILLSQIRDFPNMEGQVSVFISPSFFMYPLLVIPPLSWTHLSPISDVYDSPVKAAHYHISGV
jgi:hypothetical protein